ECVGGRRPHGDARPHHPHARQRGEIGVDAAAGRDQIIGLGRCQAAERNVVHVVFGKRLPDVAGTVVVQFDRPRGAADRIRKLGTIAYFIDRELVAARNPSGLPDPGIAVGAHARLPEALGKFILEELHGAIGLRLAFELAPRRRQRVERRFGVGHVEDRNAAARNDERDRVAAHQLVGVAFLLHARRHLVALRVVRLIDVFEHDHLGAVDLPAGRLAARKTGLPGQGRVSGRVHEPSRAKPQVAVAGDELQFLDAAAVETNTAQYGTQNHGDAGGADRLLNPAAERDLVIVDHRGDRAVPTIERAGNAAEVAQDVFGDAIGVLRAVGAIGEQSAKRADNRVDGLAAEGGEAVDDRDPAPQPRRLERGRHAGNARADDADIDIDVLSRLGLPADDPGVSGGGGGLFPTLCFSFLKSFPIQLSLPWWFAPPRYIKYLN